MLDFRINKFFASAFTPEFTISNSLSIANFIVERLGQYVGEEPTILPIPQDAPHEFPRILFKPTGSQWELSVSLDRTNLTYNVDPASTSERVSEEEFSSIASNFFGHYQEQLSLAVQRLGFVTERVWVDNNALNYVLERFCEESQIGENGPFHNAERFEIHALKKYPWGGFNINSWVRIKYLPIISGENETLPAISVINDLNTLSRNEAADERFYREQIEIYFSNIRSELRNILIRYFGE